MSTAKDDEAVRCTSSEEELRYFCCAFITQSVTFIIPRGPRAVGGSLGRKACGSGSFPDAPPPAAYTIH